MHLGIWQPSQARTPWRCCATLIAAACILLCPPDRNASASHRGFIKDQSCPK
ncbi:hypothetical protein SETIT_6G160800v2 [Setaria italica]|uniref:Uncharacterized protein n=1 Tax=Setaria italica TaxID=4555 RepID=A0A368RM55_SETIT|nr:hypothetical protein SETIT_6G160800v2 [Setaria italica]